MEYLIPLFGSGLWLWLLNWIIGIYMIWQSYYLHDSDKKIGATFGITMALLLCQLVPATSLWSGAAITILTGVSFIVLKRWSNWTVKRGFQFFVIGSLGLVLLGIFTFPGYWLYILVAEIAVLVITTLLTAMVIRSKY